MVEGCGVLSPVGDHILQGLALCIWPDQIQNLEKC